MNAVILRRVAALAAGAVALVCGSAAAQGAPYWCAELPMNASSATTALCDARELWGAARRADLLTSRAREADIEAGDGSWRVVLEACGPNVSCLERRLDERIAELESVLALHGEPRGGEAPPPVAHCVKGLAAGDMAYLRSEATGGSEPSIGVARDACDVAIDLERCFGDQDRWCVAEWRGVRGWALMSQFAPAAAALAELDDDAPGRGVDLSAQGAFDSVDGVLLGAEGPEESAASCVVENGARSFELRCADPELAALAIWLADIAALADRLNILDVDRSTDLAACADDASCAADVLIAWITALRRSIGRIVRDPTITAPPVDVADSIADLLAARVRGVSDDDGASTEGPAPFDDGVAVILLEDAVDVAEPPEANVNRSIRGAQSAGGVAVDVSRDPPTSERRSQSGQVRS